MTQQTVTTDVVTLRAQLKQPEALNLYASLFLGPTFRKPFPPLLCAYWALLVRAALSGEEMELRYALGLPRGFAKTTLVKLFISWLIANTDFQFPLIVSATATKGEAVVNDIWDIMLGPNYRAVYGNVAAECSEDTKPRKIFTAFGKINIIAAIGAEGSVRGLNVHNRRPDIIILEDAQDKECADSPQRNEAFLTWMLGTLYLARSYERSICVFIGNMYNKTCALQKLRENPLWISLISAGLLADGTSLWPEFRTVASLLADYQQAVSFGKPEIFLAEVMNDPEAAANLFFQSDKIPPYPHHRDADYYASFVVIDPATGKKDSDNTAIVGAALIEGDPTVIKYDPGKYGDYETARRAIDMAIQIRACFIAVEAVGYQIALANIIIRELQLKNIYTIAVFPISTKGLSKVARITDMLRRLYSGELRIHPDALPIFLAEAVIWAPSKKKPVDDVLDVTAYVNPAATEHWQLLYSQEARTLDSEIPAASVVSEAENCAF